MASGVRWWQTRPADELVTGGDALLMADPGAEYFGYSRTGSTVELRLAAGDCTLRWFDPASGSFEPDQALTSSGDPVQLVKPDSGEWVMHVSR